MLSRLLPMFAALLMTALAPLAVAADDAAQFRLTAALLDRLDAIQAEGEKLKADDAGDEDEDEDDGDDEDDVEDTDTFVKRIEGDPRLRALLARHGVTARDFALAAQALVQAGTFLAFEGALDYPDPHTLWAIIEREGVTGVFTSPTAVRMLMRHGEAIPQSHDLSSLERVFCAGEVLNAPAWEWLQKDVFDDRVPVIDHMWQTETGGPIFGNPYGLGMLPIKPGSAGVALPGIVADVVQPDGTKVETGEKGIMRIDRPFPGLISTLWGEPERYVAEFVAAGADMVTVHVEACTHLQRTLTQIRELGARAGVALNPSTPPAALEFVLDDLDLVLVMSVNPGFGGQSFIPSAHRKLREINKLVGTRAIEVSVDGGVKADIAKSLAQDGASILVAGSAVFGAADPARPAYA